MVLGVHVCKKYSYICERVGCLYCVVWMAGWLLVESNVKSIFEQRECNCASLHTYKHQQSVKGVWRSIFDPPGNALTSIKVLY